MIVICRSVIENVLHIACSSHKLILTTFVGHPEAAPKHRNFNFMRYLLFFLALCGPLMTLAQSQSLKVADKQFSLHAYQSALDGYRQFQKSHPDDQEVILRIARCAYLLNQPAEAADWYLKAGPLTRKNPQDLTWFARSQMMNGNYPAAIELWTDLETVDPVVAQQGIRSCEFALSLRDHKTATVVKRELINSSLTEFGVWWFGGQLFFNAFNPDMKTLPAGWVQGDQFHYLMSSSPDGNGFLYPPRPVRKEVRPTPNDGPVTFSPDGRLVIFMRQNSSGNARFTPEAGFQSNLFMADVNTNGLWENIRPFPYNGISFSTAWPSLAANGKDLYFSSDREGGLGGFDIYLCHLTADGWSEPENLGEPVNTPGNEITPFLDDQSLVFASDWHVGFGGFDLFKAIRFGSRFNRIINMGSGINSSSDDLGLVMTNDPVKGYLVSNRSGHGDMDIYQWRHQLIERHLQVLHAVTGQPLEGVNLDLTPCGGAVHFSDASGMISIQMTEIPSCDITIQKSGFSPLRQNALDLLTGDDVMVLSLVPDEWNFNVTVQDADTKAPLPNTLLRVTEQRSGVFQDIHTDDQGRLRLPLRPDVLYFVNITREGYFNESRTLRLEHGPENPFAEPVRLKPVLDKENVQASGDTDKGQNAPKGTGEPAFSVQVASLSIGTKADVRPFERLAQFGTVYQKQDTERVRIRLGLFASREAAQQVARQLSDIGYPDAFVVEESVESLLDKVMLSMARDKRDQPFPEGEYLVRLAAYQNPQWFDPGNLGTYGAITEEKNGPWTIKFIRGISSISTAREALKAARDAGFAESYILFERNGNRNRIDP